MHSKSESMQMYPASANVDVPSKIARCKSRNGARIIRIAKELVSLEGWIEQQTGAEYEYHQRVKKRDVFQSTLVLAIFQLGFGQLQKIKHTMHSPVKLLNKCQFLVELRVPFVVDLERQEVQTVPEDEGANHNMTMVIQFAQLPRL